jgi:hypothetical protein
MNPALLRRVEKALRLAWPEPEPGPDFSTMTELERFWWSVKKHGLQKLARRAAASREKRAQTAPEAQPEMGAAPAPVAEAEPPPPVETKPPPEPEPKTPTQQWIDERCWWRLRGPDDYIYDDADVRPNQTLHDYDPLG